MDVSFSSKPQILTLFSCNHFSSTSSSLSPSKLRSIRSEFLGFGHNLRPPGGLLRSRRRNRKSGPYFYSTRFRFRASLTSHSVLVVVAVVTFSAVSIFYWNRFRPKKNAEMVSFNFEFRFFAYYFDFLISLFNLFNKIK